MDAFSNSENPIIPLGKLDILGCRNRLPKVFENLQYLDVQRTFFMKNHQICFIKPIQNRCDFRTLKTYYSIRNT